MPRKDPRSYYLRHREAILANAKARRKAMTPAQREHERKKQREATAKWAKAHPDAAAKKNRGIKERVRDMLARARLRASRKGLTFDLRVGDIVFLERCPVFDTPFTFDPTGNKAGPLPTSPSLDRIDNAKGYVTSNVRVISQRANGLKKDATIAELRAILAYMEEHEMLDSGVVK